MRLSIALPLGTLVCLLAASASGQEEKLDLPPVASGQEITLAEAMRMADARNLSLQAARTDILRAEAELKRAWASILPVASGTLTFTHNDHADTVNMSGQTIEIRKQEDLKGSLRVSMPLINAQSWVGISLGDTYVEASELAVEQIRQALLLSVAQAYYQALTAHSLIEVQTDQIKRSRRHLTVASLRHRAGVENAGLDVIRAQTELLVAREALIQAHTSYDNSRDALAILIGVAGLPMPVETAEIKPPAEGEEERVSKATRQREDIRLSHAQVELADSDLTLTWMSFIPSLNASWNLTQQLSDLSDFADEDTNRWYIGLTLNIPLYDHTRYAQLDLKRAALTRAQLEAEDAKQQAELEVRRARRDYLNAVALVTTARKKAELGRQSLELAESAYENGTGNSLDVTDARRSSRAAEIDLATKRFGAQVALLSLLRTIGQDMSKL